MKTLLAIDGSEYANAAVEFLQRFPLPQGSEIILLTVIDSEVFKGIPVEHLSKNEKQILQDTRDNIQEIFEQLLAAGVSRLQHAGWPASSHLRVGHPAEEIAQMAKELDVDLIVVGSHGLSSVKRLFIGSVSDSLLEHAPCPVLVVKKQDEEDLSSTAASKREERLLRILLAYDEYTPARQAAEFCASLPLNPKSEITILNVLPLFRLYRQDVLQHMSWAWHEKEKGAKKSLDQVTEECTWNTPHIKAILRESPDVSQEILDAAVEFNSDLIVLGHKENSATKKFLRGAITPRIAHQSPCSILVVRGQSAFLTRAETKS